MLERFARQEGRAAHQPLVQPYQIHRHPGGLLLDRAAVGKREFRQRYGVLRVAQLVVDHALQELTAPWLLFLRDQREEHVRERAGPVQHEDGALRVPFKILDQVACERGGLAGAVHPEDQRAHRQPVVGEALVVVAQVLDRRDAG